MAKIELKPCPFCGREATTVFYTGYIYVSCEKCGATSEMVKVSKEYCAAEKEAAEAWNRRTDIDILTANIKSEAAREFADKLKCLVNQKKYMLADIHNSKDFGMFTIGFEQVIDEIVKEMTED